MVSANDDPYRSEHGLPRPRVDRPAELHWKIELMKTALSLPPMVMVTSSVSGASASSCGGTPRELRGEEVARLGRAAGHVGELRAGRGGEDVRVVAAGSQAGRRRRQVRGRTPDAA